jgi:hypothetical protein
MVQLLPPELCRHQPRSAVAQVVEGRHAPQGGGQHCTATISSGISVIIKLINLQRHTAGHAWYD